MLSLADPSETTNLLDLDHITAEYEAIAKKAAERLAHVGASAPPVSRYFQEANTTHGGDGKGGGYFQDVLNDICSAMANTSFLEPTQ